MQPTSQPARLVLVQPPRVQGFAGSYVNGKIWSAGAARILNLAAVRGRSGAFLDAELHPDKTPEQIRRIFANKILAETPLVVGLTTTYATHPEALKLVGYLRSGGYSGKIIMGGYVSSALPFQVVNNDGIDYAVVGAGEKAILTLLEGNDAHTLPGVYTKRNGTIFGPGSNTRAVFKLSEREEKLNWGGGENPDPLAILDGPWLDVDPYFTNQTKAGLTSRLIPVIFLEGCGYGARGVRCTFCCEPGGPLQELDAERVVTVMNYWKGKVQGSKVEFFSGADSLPNPRWIIQLSEKISEGEGKFRLYARADELKDEVVVALKKLGVTMVFVGLESGSQEILNRIKKGVNILAALDGVKKLIRAGIPTHISFVLGLPGETADTLAKTKAAITNILSEIKVVGTDPSQYVISISPLVVAPGSDLFVTLTRDEAYSHLLNTDNLDPFELIRVAERFRDVSSETVATVLKEIKQMICVAGCTLSAFGGSTE